MRARRAFESSTPTTDPVSSTPTRIFPPAAFAKPANWRAKDWETRSLNSTVAPSP